MKKGGEGVSRLSGMQRGRKELQHGVSIDDFRAYMPQHNYIFIPNCDRWPAPSVNARCPPVQVGVDEDGEPIKIPASVWLDEHRPVEQVTWSPGDPKFITDRLINEGGWIPRGGVNVFNLYLPPTIALGDPSEAASRPWLDHIRRVYPDEAEHIVRWLAQRVQSPQVKSNHALMLGGLQGIGKDTLLEPVKRAIGPWNFAEVSPPQILGRFNGFLKSTILRLSEARDLGEVNRVALYEHLKAVIAAPPDTARVDEKHIKEHYIPNVCGVIITTNHKVGGIFLPADDRRHFVAWSNLTKEDFEGDYWSKLWSWYDRGGNSNIAAYLAALDPTGFDPKAPPPKTKAFWEIVDASRAPEDAELADVIDAMALTGREGKPVPGSPVAFTLAAVLEKADSLTPIEKKRDGLPIAGTFAHWLNDRKNRRIIPHRFEGCGFSPVRNPSAPEDGYWYIKGKRQAVYARAELPESARVVAAKMVADSCGETVLQLS